MANNRIQVKRSSTAGRTPNTTSAGNTQYIAAGELALNMTDQTFFTSDGTNLIYVGANVPSQHITNSLTVDNDKSIYFKTVNTSARASMIQQSDDNFVFYTTNTSYGQRAVYSIFANSNSSEFSFSAPVRFNSNVTALVANGTTGSAGQILATNGSNVYWVTLGAAAVNTAAQFGWTNTHTFSANVSFTGNGIGITSNTGAIYLGGINDANWKIGRNTGVVTKWVYSNNTVDIVTANSNLEGMAIGLVGGNSYFETGYLGTFIANTITIGNSSSNSTVNSTVFSGTANNATYFGGYTWAAPAVLGSTTANGASLTYANVSGQVNAASLLLSTNTATIGTGTYFVSNGNVGIGTISPAYKLQVNGSFAATTKSFVIDHPTKTGMKLRYGSLEGPENGVYFRGRITSSVIELPEHWEGLVDADSITVSLTPIGKSIMPTIFSYDNKKVVLDVADDAGVNCFYHIFGERKDVSKLVVEF